MRVLETHKGSPGGLRFSTRDDPVPGRGEVLIDVKHVSLNFGESRRSMQNQEPDGSILGWDAAGFVSALGPDCQAPPIGTPVVTRALQGGWAEKRLARSADTAVVPAGVDLAVASTLPTAATTALAALQGGGPILGRTVLVTGASGGVGRFAVQLAKIGGARVIAIVGSNASVAGLKKLGADCVSVGMEGISGNVDLVVDSVGGRQMVQAFSRLNPGGVIQSVGWASQEEAVFSNMVGKSARQIRGLLISNHDVGPLLQPLLGWFAEGRLRVDVSWRGSWERYAEAIEILVGRRLHGKAVLDVAP